MFHPNLHRTCYNVQSSQLTMVKVLTLCCHSGGFQEFDDRADQLRREKTGVYLQGQGKKKPAPTPRCGCSELSGVITMRRGEEAEEDDVFRLHSVLDQHPHCLNHRVPCACRRRTEGYFLIHPL